MILIEMTSLFAPADGSTPRAITIRVSDLRQNPKDELWSVAVDVVGFKSDDHVRLKGADWLNAIEGAMGFLRGLAGGKVEDDGGTISPELLPLSDSREAGATPSGGWLRPSVQHVPDGPRGVILVETISTFKPADGSAPRTIMIRVSDLQQDPDDAWSVIVDVVGFDTDEHVSIKGADWVNAIEGAALFIREGAGEKVKNDGGAMTPLLLPP